MGLGWISKVYRFVDEHNMMTLLVIDCRASRSLVWSFILNEESRGIIFFTSILVCT